MTIDTIEFIVVLVQVLSDGTNIVLQPVHEAVVKTATECMDAVIELNREIQGTGFASFCSAVVTKVPVS